MGYKVATLVVFLGMCWFVANNDPLGLILCGYLLPVLLVRDAIIGIREKQHWLMVAVTIGIAIGCILAATGSLIKYLG